MLRKVVVTKVIGFFLVMTLGAFQTPTEEQKIAALIKYVANLRDAVFIRNGSEYTAERAAEHLRMKRKKAGTSVKTALEFINHIASVSSMTNQEYKVRFKDGSIITLRELLLNELTKMR